MRYAGSLWSRGLPARAVLALVRGLYLWPATTAWPAPENCPYAALCWMLNAPRCPGLFYGNPRLSFQHQAVRMPARCGALRSVRATAAWHLASAHNPHALPLDPDCAEPLLCSKTVTQQLQTLGAPGEAQAFVASRSVGACAGAACAADKDYGST